MLAPIATPYMLHWINGHLFTSLLHFIVTDDGLLIILGLLLWCQRAFEVRLQASLDLS